MTKLEEAIKLIKTLRQDAVLALDGDWDKSDSGFEAQIVNIDKFLNSLEPKKSSKFKQLKLI